MAPLARAPRRLALCLPAALLAFAAACADDGATPPTSVRPPDAEGTLGVLQCEVVVTSGDLSCVDASGGGASASLSPRGGPALDRRTVGAQGSMVRLANSGNSLVGGVYSINVTVQNLANLAMGTSDGATRHGEGVRVFFSTAPHATSGHGSVTIANATGTAMFTAADQSYFQYGGSIGGTDQGELGADGILASAEASSAKQWQFNMDATVTSFGFVVLVRTETPSGTLSTVAPQVTGTSAATLVPGQTVTLTGLNFNATPASNTVRIGGAVAAVTGGSTTSLDVVVPCRLSGPVGVQVTQGGMTGVALQRTLQAPQRTLAVGASVIVSDGAQAGCNEITASGVNSKYIVAVYNTSTSPGSTVALQLSGDPTGAAAAVDASSSALSLGSSPRQSVSAAAEDRHMELMEKNRAEYERLRTRFARDPRMRASTGVVNADPVDPPATRNFKVSNINTASICSNYFVVSATRVYFNGKIAIYEDDATPAGLKASANPAMADYYTRIGNQYNADMEPIIRHNFGDVLRRDAVTDNNGVLIALFTPVINNNFGGVAGFVVSCDQFPDADAGEPGVGGPYTGTANANGASNFGEVFYAYQPTVEGTGYAAHTPDQWYRTIRSTFIHETKHVASFSARVANGAPSGEVSWLEEGTARHSEELWGRQAVDGMAWKGNTGYGSAANPINVYCDVRVTGDCILNPRRPASVMQRHFFSLYTHMNTTNGALLSPFGKTPYDNSSYFYAISWSLARYAIDRYGASDAAFLTALNQSTTTGATNLAARAGVPLEQLMGGWALSLAADDYPGLASPGLDIQMPTWNFRDIYAGINADGFSTLAYPLVPTALSYGPFSAVTVPELYGGGVRWYEFSGVQTAPQLVRLQGSGGGTLPSTVRVAITRVQ